MAVAKLQNKTYDEIQVNDIASVSRILTKKDIELFAIMSGDVNPAHLDEEFASSDIFKEIVAHGMWGASLISMILGTMLPGPGTIYLGQTLKFVAPIVVGDEVKVSVKVIEKRNDKHVVILDCRCTNQRGEDVIIGEAKVIAPKEKISREIIKLPRVMLVSDSISDYYDKILSSLSKIPPLQVAVVHPTDAASIESAIIAAQDKIIQPIFIGPKTKIEKAAKEGGSSLDGYKIIDAAYSEEAADIAVKLVHTGEAEAIMKGNIHTDELMHPIVKKDTGLRTERRMSHVFLVIAPTYYKPLLITDAAINVFPDLMTKRDIVQNSIDLYIALYSTPPKVAIISAVETVTEKLTATLDAAALCKMAERGQIVGGVLDGPLAFDNAISKEAAQMKGIISAVAGDPDIIIVPNIETGNALYKQMRYMANVEGAGIVIGARVPIILTSRSEGSVVARKLSCALAAMYSHRKDGLIKPLKLEEHM